MTTMNIRHSFLPVLATLLAVVLAACTPTPPRQDVATQPLKVASWNLEHLAADDGLGCRPRTEADYATLRGYVDRLDADVIAFAEVENAKAAARVFTPDKYTVLMSARPGGVRHGFCKRDATSGPTIRKQDVGFAIRKGLHFEKHAELKDIALGNPDLRWGVDISVDHDGQPLRLLAVHLKSGCSGGDKSGACPVLFDQVPVLHRWIVQREQDRSAFIVLGDFNRRLALAGDSVWKDLNANLPGQTSLVDAGAGTGANCQKRYPDFIDHIVVGGTAVGRVQPGSFAEFDYGVPEDQHPSDHCPISVTIN